MIDKFYGPFAALCVGGLGALLAYWALTIGWPVAAIVCVALAFVAWLVGDSWANSLSWKSVRRAGWLSEAWVLKPLSMAAGITAVLIIAKAWSSGRSVPGVPTADSKEIIDAVSTTLVAFVGAILLKAAADADDEWAAPHFKKLLGKHFKADVAGVSTDEVLYYNPEEKEDRLKRALTYENFPGGAGWSFSARRKRVAIIEEEVKKPKKRP